MRREAEIRVKEAEIRGKVEGMAEGKVEVALTMLANGMDIESVSKFTGLPLNEVKQLKH